MARVVVLKIILVNIVVMHVSVLLDEIRVLVQLK